MQNAASKLAAIGLLALTLTACSSKSDNTEAAQALLEQAKASIENGDYGQAQVLLDSLNNTYSDAIEVRKEGNKLLPAIIEGNTMQEAADLQVQLQYLTQYIDSVSAEFKHVDASDEVYEPYSVHKDVAANWRDRNTAVSRITPSGEFVVISSLSGGNTHHTALRLTSADGVSVTSGEVPYSSDGVPSLSRESVRFPSAQADTLGAFAVQMDGRGPLTLEFVGGKSAPKARLTEKEVHAMASTYRLSSAIRAAQAGAYRLEQLNAKLQLARDQSARINTPAE